MTITERYKVIDPRIGGREVQSNLRGAKVIGLVEPSASVAPAAERHAERLAETDVVLTGPLEASLSGVALVVYGRGRHAQKSRSCVGLCRWWAAPSRERCSGPW